MFTVGQKVRCIDNVAATALQVGGIYTVMATGVVVSRTVSLKEFSDWGTGNSWMESRFVAFDPTDYLSACEALPFPAPVMADDGAVYDYDGNRCEVKREEVGTRWIWIGDIPMSSSGERFDAGFARSDQSKVHPDHGKPSRIYALYDLPVSADGTVLDPIRLGELGYYVTNDPRLGIRGTLFADSWETNECATFIEAWQLCAKHYLTKGSK